MIAMIETERLYLRTFQPEDLSSYHATIYGNADVMTYLPGGIPRPVEVVRETMDYFVSHQERYGFSIWAVFEKESQTFVGHAGLIHAPRTDERLPQDVELAYAFGKAYWGSGYATEVARASLKFGFEEIELDKIIALAFSANVPSQRVMQKIGMTYKGVSDLYHGATLVLYEMKRGEWEKKV